MFVEKSMQGQPFIIGFHRKTAQAYALPEKQ